MAKQLGRGSKLYRGDAASAANFVEVTQIANIGEVAYESQEVESTDLSSSAREYLSALATPSEVPVQLQWDPLNATHQTIKADQASGEVRYWKIEVYRGAPLVLIRTLTFQSFVKRDAVGPFSNQDILSKNFTLRISGAVTEA